MNFDRSKAMRNAERFVAQGKIRSAIDEYKQVIRNDPRDFGTLNMLGDLYVKDEDSREAVRCYTGVAEHYAKQGFAQKAIAIYNKIIRLKPDSPEITEKLADLYKSKGSLSEARSHYTTLADHYMSKGYKMEALAIWKQIALLDPNNTEVYINLAEAYLGENALDEAADAYAEAAGRFSRAGDHEAAVDSFTKALAIEPSNLNSLNGFIAELKQLGRQDEASTKLHDILQINPRNREAARLLIDCHIDCGRPDDAEKVLIKLVEHEPSNYAKFLDLVKIYLERFEASSASRALSMCSEHMLIGGQSEEFLATLQRILAIDEKDLAAIRMLARFYSWKRDKDELVTTLGKMARVSRECDAVEDERYALSQLTLIVPHEIRFSERLDEINREYGFEENPFDNTILREQFGDVSAELLDEAPTILVAADPTVSGANGHAADQLNAAADLAQFKADTTESSGEEILVPSYEPEIEKEIESVRFYIENDYAELAERTLAELRKRFGELPELVALETQLKGAEVERNSTAKRLDIAEIRNEFGLDEADQAVEGDYDTHYQMAVAYQEMGLIEEAIKEYQAAINLVRPDAPDRRFFQCANLLGHCFMQRGMANPARTWYDRALETAGLTDDEKQGVWYELAHAYEAEGDIENAGRYFEQIYAENVDYRDVSERIRKLALQAA